MNRNLSNITWEEIDKERDERFIAILGKELWDWLGEEAERRGYTLKDLQDDDISKS